MQRRIIVSSDDYEIRVAIVENSKLAEYYFERHNEQRIVGNIYKGVVTSIIPGIEAAFVDIGLPRNAFLYVNDLYPQIDEFGYFTDEENGFEDGEEEIADTELPPLNIRDMLKEQQQILVQLHKEPIGAKGSRITTNISLPGRYLVLLPSTKHIGISRRIEEPEERNRLKELVSQLLPENMGAIVRTAGKEMGKEEFGKDLQFLLTEWDKIQKKGEKAAPPAKIHQNPGMVFLIIRDLIADGIDEIVVD